MSLRATTPLSVTGHRQKPKTVNLIALSILSGALLSLPFFNGRLWFFSWFGFLPLFSALSGSRPRSAFLLVYLSGIAFWSATIYWLVHVTFLGQLFLILYLSLYFGIFGLFVFRLLRPSRVVDFLFIASAWVILEYLRSHLFTGFGWALLGHSQYLNPMVIQIADLTGAYGVSFLVMAVNLNVYDALANESQQPKRKGKYLLCVVFVLAMLAYGYYRMYGAGLPHGTKRYKISVVQANIPQELKWDSRARKFILDKYAHLTRAAAAEGADLIVWPEASSPGIAGEDESVFEYIFALAEEVKIPLVVGTVIRENNEYFNSALLIGADGTISGRYDKLHLVPFGEYVPLKKVFRFLEAIVPIGDMSAGKEYTVFSDRGRRFSVLICFEDTVPELGRRFVNRGADMLLNITNDGWYKETTAAYQHLGASVFRAVENRVPLVRSANTGVSCFIDIRGRIVSIIEVDGKNIFVEGVKTCGVVLEKGKSAYLKIGDMFVFVCLAVVVFYVIICRVICARRPGSAVME